MYCFHSKNLFYPPPILICVNLLPCLSASLGMVILGFWWRKLPRSSRLLLVFSVLFCPLLSYSLSSVSLRDFFGVAHLITVAGQATSSYRNVLLLFFLVMAKLERAQFLRMAYRKRCYTLYLLFLLFSLLSRLHRNNANNPDTLFFG